MAAKEMKLGKHLCKIFIDVTDGAEEPDWAQIDKSTVLDIAMNPETETQDYISMEMPVEEIKGYKPTLDQEIAAFANNRIYEFMFGKFYKAEATQVKCLICFPPHGDPSVQEAWMVPIATCILNNMNYAEGKLTWNMSLGGNIQRGTYTLSSDDMPKPTFVKAAA